MSRLFCGSPKMERRGPGKIRVVPFLSTARLFRNFIVLFQIGRVCASAITVNNLQKNERTEEDLKDVKLRFVHHKDDAETGALRSTMSNYFRKESKPNDVEERANSHDSEDESDPSSLSFPFLNALSSKTSRDTFRMRYSSTTANSSSSSSTPHYRYSKCIGNNEYTMITDIPAAAAVAVNGYTSVLVEVQNCQASFSSPNGPWTVFIGSNGGMLYLMYSSFEADVIMEEIHLWSPHSPYSTFYRVLNAQTAIPHGNSGVYLGSYFFINEGASTGASPGCYLSFADGNVDYPSCSYGMTNAGFDVSYWRVRSCVDMYAQTCSLDYYLPAATGINSSSFVQKGQTLWIVSTDAMIVFIVSPPPGTMTGKIVTSSIASSTWSSAIGGGSGGSAGGGSGSSGSGSGTGTGSGSGDGHGSSNGGGAISDSSQSSRSAAGLQAVFVFVALFTICFTISVCKGWINCGCYFYNGGVYRRRFRRGVRTNSTIVIDEESPVEAATPRVVEAEVAAAYIIGGGHSNSGLNVACDVSNIPTATQVGHFSLSSPNYFPSSSQSPSRSRMSPSSVVGIRNMLPVPAQAAVSIAVARPVLTRAGAQRRLAVGSSSSNTGGGTEDAEEREEEAKEEEEHGDRYDVASTSRDSRRRRMDVRTGSSIGTGMAAVAPMVLDLAAADSAGNYDDSVSTLSRNTAQSLAGLRAYRSLEPPVPRHHRWSAASSSGIGSVSVSSPSSSSMRGARVSGTSTAAVASRRRDSGLGSDGGRTGAGAVGSVPTSARSVHSTDDVSDAVTAVAAVSRRGQLVSQVYSAHTLRAQVVSNSVNTGFPRVVATQFHFPQANAVPVGVSGRSDTHGHNNNNNNSHNNNNISSSSSSAVQQGVVQVQATSSLNGGGQGAGTVAEGVSAVPPDRSRSTRSGDAPTTAASASTATAPLSGALLRSRQR